MAMYSNDCVAMTSVRLLPKTMFNKFIYKALSSPLCISLISFVNERWIPFAFRNASDLLVNCGCGSQAASGWVNFDYFIGRGVICINLFRPMPLPSDSAAIVFAEHFLEHLGYMNQALAFLKEVFRVLRPGGVIRVIVPDGAKYLHAYCSAGWDELVKTRPLVLDSTSLGNSRATDIERTVAISRYKDYWTATIYSTKMELINEVFRQNGEHKFCYDYETLAKLFSLAGFADIRPSSYGSSRTSVFMPESKARSSESIYIEASKPCNS